MKMVIIMNENENEKGEMPEEEISERAQTEDELKQELTQTFTHIEFNNEQEDLEVVKEEKWKRSASIRKVMLILGSILFVVGLWLVLFPKVKDLFHKSNVSKTKVEEEFHDTGVYKSHSGTLLLNRYIYDSDTHTLMDLSFKEILKVNNPSYLRIIGDDLYIVSRNNQSFAIEKIVEGKAVSIFKKTANGTGLISNVGFYTDGGKKLYFFENDSYREVSLSDGIQMYSFSSDDGEDKYMAGENLIFTQNVLGKLGLYRVDNKQELIKPIYDELVRAKEGIFVAVKNEKAGIIDMNGKVLLDFRYDVLEPAGDYYIAGTGNSIVLLDSNYKEIPSSTLRVNRLNQYQYHSCCSYESPFYTFVFASKFFVATASVGNSYTYSYLNENQEFVSLFTTNSSSPILLNNYLIVKDDQRFMVYNSNLQKVGSIVGEEVIGTFLNNVLITKKDNQYYFMNLETGEDNGRLNRFSRDHGEYLLTFHLENDGRGRMVISKEEKELETLENASFDAFIYAGDSRFFETSDLLVYHAQYSSNGDILVIRK